MFDFRQEIDFGHWLAGFADGEGCFTISASKGIPACRFRIALREDDAAILEEIQRRTGIGWIWRRGETDRGRPQVGWEVVTKADVQELVDLFDHFPLRAKKAADFAIWREAALLWAKRGPGPRGPRSKLSDADIAKAVALREEGVSQIAIAVKLGVTASYVSRLLGGRRRQPRETDPIPEQMLALKSRLEKQRRYRESAAA